MQTGLRARLLLGMIAIGAIGAIAAGCKQPAAPCMTMSPPSELVGRAALLRLDVYSSDVHCAGATVTPGSPPPTLSKEVAGGQPIMLDIPAGQHALLLSAFADTGATQLLGSACTEAKLEADSSACFNLTLAEAPDLSMPPPPMCDGGPCACTTVPDDCPTGQYCGVDGNCANGCKVPADCNAPGASKCDVTQHRCVECLLPADCPAGKRCSPSGACVDGCDVAAGSPCAGSLQCCSNLCLDTTQDLASCGACGRTCASTNVSAAACTGGLCKPQCVAGHGDCNQPIAPAADDGCETNVFDIAHCGTCTNVCSLMHATPKCPSGTCQVQSCTAGFFNCDAADATGCECAGVDRMDTMNGCCPAGACQAQHSDGFTHSFYDCVALNTYTLQLAKDAGGAYNLGGATDADSIIDTGSVYCTRRRTGPLTARVTVECVCWAYAGAAVGFATHVLAECQTPLAADTAWK